MGYSHYDTPKGPAGYAVEDVCHEDGCDKRIDRGIAYRCGDSLPGGAEDDAGNCGWWYCESHLGYVPDDEVHWFLCARDVERWQDAHQPCGNCEERGANCECVPDGDTAEEASA